jgi:hypothetical protein
MYSEADRLASLGVSKTVIESSIMKPEDVNIGNKDAASGYRQIKEELQAIA